MQVENELWFVDKPVPLPLSQSDVLELLADMHRFELVQRTALLSRLQHFKRLGFPAGVNVGKGYKARYDIPQIVQLLVAFEILELGVTPERIVRLLDANSDLLVIAAGLGSDRLSYDLFDNDPSHAVYLFFDPATLQAQASDEDPAQDSTMGWGFEQETSAAIFSGGRRIAVINASQMLNMAAQHLVTSDVCSRDQFRRGLFEWAANFNWLIAAPDHPAWRGLHGDGT